MDPEAVQELRTALARLDALHSRAEAVNGTDPQAGSAGAADAALPHARFVLTNAGRSLTVAVDHLGAWSLIVQAGTIPLFAPMTLLRAALEAASLARWLIDADVASATRVARGVAVQLADHEERKRFETAGEIPAGPGGKSAAGRAADLRAARDRDGVPLLPVERATTLAKLYGPPGHADRSWLYRLTSAFAHGKEWALLAMTLGQTEAAGEGYGRGLMSANDKLVAGTTTLTVLQVELSVGAMEAYVGAADH
jgi:hypothetical protein